MNDSDIENSIGKIAELIHESKRLMIFTGAGISTESGIPDFRSPGGIWDRFDPDDFTLDKFISDVESRRKQWRMFGEGMLSDKAEPNKAHIAIAELYDFGKLDCVVTQNIDNLHQKAGVPGEKIFELHGNMNWASCMRCGQRYPFEEIKARLESGEEIPDCKICSGMLKPDIVMFGEQLPVDVLEEASRRAIASDLCIVIGSTLIVYPAAYIPIYAVQSGAGLVIINLSETPVDDKAEVVINTRAGDTMAEIVSQYKKIISN
jgi:NAD-dependent deacetylase